MLAKIKALGGLSIFTVVFGMAGCSSNEVVQEVLPTVPPVVKTYSKPLPVKVVKTKSSLDRAFSKASIKSKSVSRPQPKRVVRVVPKPRYRPLPKKVIVKPKYKPVLRKRAPQVVRTARRISPQRIQRPLPKRAVRQVRRPQPLPDFLPRNIQYPKSNSLRGDFSGNLNTISFINMMAKQHGFDRRYLNYLFSNTHATTFLKKMAYNDANPRKRKSSGKSRKGSWTRYRNLFLTSKTIDKGVAFWRQNRSAFERAERRFGVPQEYILGIIGVETRYGGNVGQNRAIDALATMGFRNARRGKYFQSELESFLLMSRRTGLNPLNPKASYAGALGLCQFMPSNIKLYGVDMDRRGGCNLWTPADAIGSVANYFSKHGWRTGDSVAVRTTTKGRGYKKYKHSYKIVHSLSKIKRAGVKPLGPIGQKVRLLRMDTYDGDEVWLADHNFYVITRYNHSSKYAMAVHQLAQAIKRRIKPRYRTAGL